MFLFFSLNGEKSWEGLCIGCLFLERFLNLLLLERLQAFVLFYLSVYKHRAPLSPSWAHPQIPGPDGTDQASSSR